MTARRLPVTKDQHAFLDAWLLVVGTGQKVGTSPGPTLVALMGKVRRGELRRLRSSRCPLGVLAQSVLGLAPWHAALVRLAASIGMVVSWSPGCSICQCLRPPLPSAHPRPQVSMGTGNHSSDVPAPSRRQDSTSVLCSGQEAMHLPAIWLL